MGTSRIHFCRWAAGIFLVAAFLMLVLGLTLFSGRLRGTDFLIYWLLCFLFTGLAAIFALTDLAAVRRKSRDAQQNLLKETLEQTEKDAHKSKSPDSE